MLNASLKMELRYCSKSNSQYIYIYLCLLRQNVLVGSSLVLLYTIFVLIFDGYAVCMNAFVRIWKVLIWLRTERT
jgi:hypothetical protein